MKRSVLLVSNFLASATTPGVADALAVHLRASGWQVLTTSSQPRRALRLLDMLATIWRRRTDYAVAQIDVYSTLAFFWAEAASALLRLLGKPFVLTLHGGGLPALAQRSPARVRRLLAAAAAVTVPSRYLCDQMKDYRSDLRLLPNPLDISAYTFRLRRHLEPRLMWIRSFHRVYNPGLAPRVLGLVRQSSPTAHLTMVGPDKGDGSLDQTLALIREQGLGEHVTLPGRCDKAAVPGWLQRGDIFLNTTDVDNTPISVMEAMACGLPVVSTNVGGLPYLLEDERDALLVPQNDPVAMAAAVRRLIEHPDVASQIATNAREKVERFDWHLIVAEWDHLLRRAIDGRAAEPLPLDTLSRSASE